MSRWGHQAIHDLVLLATGDREAARRARMARYEAELMARLNATVE